ncbi:MAG: hypothetical protein U1E78_07175 [Gammaproteobacteria bacterium]
MSEGILKILENVLFAICILFIMVLGRNLILKSDARLFPKTEHELTKEDKKIARQKYLGRGLLWLSSPFIVFWGYSLWITL